MDALELFESGACSTAGLARASCTRDSGRVFKSLYVIHCKRLVARREYLQPILRNLRWNVRWIDSYDPSEIPRRHLLRFKLGAPLLTVGEISVYLKHLEAFRNIARHEEEVGFIIEDDAVFPPEFPATFARYLSALTVPFDFVFFGACDAVGELASEDGRLFVECARTRSMSGYLITAVAAAKLLAELEDRPIQAPLELTVNRIFRSGAFNVLWSQPPLLLNGSETKLFEHSLGVPWREGISQPSLYRRTKQVMDRLLAAMSVRR